MTDHPMLINAPNRNNGTNHRALLVSTMPVTDRRVELAGIPTAILEGGEGPPVVLLHGQGEFAAIWLPVIAQLAQQHRVIAADLPGHGASGLGNHPLDVDRMVAWTDELIGATCDKPPVVSGHLMGGALALRYASAHPDRLRQLVLVNSLGLGPFRPSLRFFLAMVSFVAFPTESTRDRLFDRCMLNMDTVRRQLGDRWDAMAAYALERARSPELKSALRSLMPKLAMPAIPAEDLARLAVPTGMIWGRHDLQAHLSVAEAAHARYGWPLHVIEGAADDPAVERPEAFMEAWNRLVGYSPRGVRDARGPAVHAFT